MHLLWEWNFCFICILPLRIDSGGPMKATSAVVFFFWCDVLFDCSWFFIIFVLHFKKNSIQNVIWCRVLGPSAMRPLPIDESALNFSLPPYHCVAKRGDREKLLRTTLNSVKTKLLLYHRFFCFEETNIRRESVSYVCVCFANNVLFFYLWQWNVRRDECWY